MKAAVHVFRPAHRFSAHVGAAALVVFAAGAAALACDCDEKQPAKRHCPVVGVVPSKVDGCPSGYCPRCASDEHTLAYRGGKIQFCCGKCVKIFQAKPAPYAASANHQLVATGQAKQVHCPLCGGRALAAHSLEIAGVRVGFCSAKCQEQARKAAGKDQLELILGDRAFTRGFEVAGAKKTPSR